MRYQELREGRTRLENAIKYAEATRNNEDFGDAAYAKEIAINMLRMALASVRLEIKRPELFELDGTPRVRMVRYA